MNTMTTPAPSVKPSRKAPRPFSCSIVSLVVEINDARYNVDAIPAGEFGTKAYRLTKHGRDGAVYDVIRRHDGIVACDCPDYVARHEGNGYGMCKHGRALVELGMLAAPIAPSTIPTPATTIEPPADDEPAPAACCTHDEPAPCTACTDAAGWPGWTDTDSWTTTEPEPEPPAEPPVGAVPFADWIAGKALSLHQDGTTAALWLARKLDELAEMARYLQATTPEEYDARESVMDDDRDGEIHAAGFDAALATFNPLS